MKTDNDFDRFAVDIIQCVQAAGEHKPTDYLIRRVSDLLQRGPLITVWPRDQAEASQRARDRALAAATRRPELPRPLTPPTLPRALIAPSLPRPLQSPGLPRPLVAPTLPRSLPPLKR